MMELIHHRKRRKKHKKIKENRHEISDKKEQIRKENEK